MVSAVVSCRSNLVKGTYVVPESSATVMAVSARIVPFKAIPSQAIDQNATETTGFQLISPTYLEGS